MGLTLEQQKALALAKARVRAKSGAKKYEGPMAGADQFSSGLNEGIASFAGAPVDLVTGALNLGSKGINYAAGTNIPPIENPVGGSESIRGLMDPLISGTDPQTAAQRYLRRGGQELGFGIPAAMTGAAISGYGAVARDAMKPYMATSMAGDVGAALGGQTAREIAPNNPTMDVIASMIGGGGLAYGASRMTPETVPVQSLDELKKANKDKWAIIRESPDTLSPEASARLSPELYAMLTKERATNPNLFPRANATVEDITALPPKSLYEVEEARRLAGRNVAANADEAAVGVEMKKTIDEYLTGLKPEDVQGADPEAAIGLMRDARKGSHQAFKADEILNKEMRGESRAATTGTGGNEVNATKQNIRAIFDRERDPTLRGKSGGYTPDEMAAMDRVVFGDTKSNIARLLGRLSPNSGALPLMASGGGLATAAAGLATGNPLMTLAAAPSMVGMIGKTAAENMTKKDIERLMKTILNGGKAPAKSAARTAADRAVLQQLLMSPSGNPQ